MTAPDVPLENIRFRDIEDPMANIKEHVASLAGHFKALEEKNKAEDDDDPYDDLIHTFIEDWEGD